MGGLCWVATCIFMNVFFSSFNIMVITVTSAFLHSYYNIFVHSVQLVHFCPFSDTVLCVLVLTLMFLFLCGSSFLFFTV